MSKQEEVLEALQSLPKFNAADAHTYEALCHCGKVQYTVTLSPPLERQKVVSCNCSFCSRNGYLLVYPSREHVNVKCGEESLRTYTFGRKYNLHKFCGTCGSSVFFDPRLKEHGQDVDLLGINVRMFKDVKLNELPLIYADGWREWPFLEGSEHLK